MRPSSLLHAHFSLLSLYIFITAFFTTPVVANTEKILFVAPSSVQLPRERPDLDDLCLDTLSPAQPSLSTSLPVVFPTTESPNGTESWYLLDYLMPRDRYELRVCWLATQPTVFTLETFTLADVFNDPHLSSAIAGHSSARELSCQGRRKHDFRYNYNGAAERSVLFLRVQSAADFVSTNRTLMGSPPDVRVNFVLDPYTLYALPVSLIPTAIFILVVSTTAWHMSRSLSSWLHYLALPEDVPVDFVQGASLIAKDKRCQAGGKQDGIITQSDRALPRRRASRKKS